MRARVLRSAHRVNAQFSWKILLRGRMSARHVPWIQISLKWGDMSRRQNNVTPRLHARSPRVNCSCNMSPRHFRKINQSENEITICSCDKTLRVNTSRNLSPQHAPLCEQRMKFFPATCPCNMSPRVCRPLQFIAMRAPVFTVRSYARACIYTSIVMRARVLTICRNVGACISRLS